ncbi:MAG: hypothetical protein GX596_03805, partial [Propionibacterium sp.]|nr:hypothetical protein [Propionibacterium sp.]
MQEFGRPWRIAGAAAWLALMLGGVGFFAHLALTMDGTASALVMLVPILTLALLAVDAARSLGLVARGRLSTRQIAQLSQSDSLFIRGHAIHRRAGRIARRAPTQLGHLIPRLREERRILRDALEQGLANPTAVAIRSVEQVLAPIQ